MAGLGLELGYGPRVRTRVGVRTRGLEVVLGPEPSGRDKVGARTRA